MCTKRTILCKVANDEDEKKPTLHEDSTGTIVGGFFFFIHFNMCTVCIHYDDNFGLYIVNCFLVFQIASKYSLARSHV